MKSSRYGLALEGWPFLLLFLALTAWTVAGSQPAVAVAPALLMVFVIMKFRDPSRTVPAVPLGVISPVDGIVAGIVHGKDELRLLLRIAPFSPYLLRSPTEGNVVESRRERAGHGFNIRTDEGEEVFLRLEGPHWLPSASAVDYGERVGQGQRCGLLRAAHTAEIWLPVDAELQVERGARVTGGETVLARFHGNGNDDGNGK